MSERDEMYTLDGSVQIDDAYLGGERSGGKAGRGSENKVPFVAAVSLDEQGGGLHGCHHEIGHGATLKFCGTLEHRMQIGASRRAVEVVCGLSSRGADPPPDQAIPDRQATRFNGC